MPFTEIRREEETCGETCKFTLDIEFKVLMKHPSENIQDMITYCWNTRHSIKIELLVKLSSLKPRLTYSFGFPRNGISNKTIN